MKVVNVSRIDYKYNLSEKSPVIAQTIFSNTVSTTIIKNTLIVIKRVDKKKASLFDILTYAIEITNIGTTKISNLIFIDMLPMGLKYITNTLILNDEFKKDVNPLNGVIINSLDPSNKINISFKALIEKVCSHKTFLNYSKVIFDYIFDISKPPLKCTVLSNCVNTIGEDNLFKEIILNKKLKITCYSISDIKNEIRIINLKLKKDKIYPDAYKLFITGVIKFRMYYNYHCNVCYSDIIEGFSTFILVPNGIDYKNNIKIKIYEEDRSFIIYNQENLYISTALLIKLT